MAQQKQQLSFKDLMCLLNVQRNSDNAQLVVVTEEEGGGDQINFLHQGNMNPVVVTEEDNAQLVVLTEEEVKERKRAMKARETNANALNTIPDLPPQYVTTASREFYKKIMDEIGGDKQ